MIPSNIPGHSRWTSHKHCCVPSLCLPLVQHVEEPVAHGVVDLDFAAVCTKSFDEGELLVCDRPVDGLSWSPQGRPLQADALRELVVVVDVS